MLGSEALLGLGGEEVGLGEVMGGAEEMFQKLQGGFDGHFLFFAHLAVEGARPLVNNNAHLLGAGGLAGSGIEGAFGHGIGRRLAGVGRGG